MQLQPDGTIEAVFPGGVQLIAESLFGNSLRQYIRWIYPSDNNSTAARIGASGVPGIFTELQAFALSQQSRVILAATDSATGSPGSADYHSQLSMENADLLDFDTYTWVRARAVSNVEGLSTERTIVGIKNNQPYSDFLLLNAPGSAGLAAVTPGSAVPVGALGAAGAGNIGPLSLGLPASIDGKAAVGVRITGGFNTQAGSQLGWAYYSVNLVAMTYNIQVRNNSTAASVATTFTPLILVAYG